MCILRAKVTGLAKHPPKVRYVIERKQLTKDYVEDGKVISW